MKNKIEGWLHQTVMNYVNQINTIQNKINEIGHIVEIGVHHGKFFIPLALLNTETANIAVDLFEYQFENISQSGHGNYDIFVKWCTTYGIKNLHIIKDNSLRLSPNDFKINEIPVRLFSIDGGHFTQEVLNDLKLAEESLSDNGVIIVDDFQHPKWDDVFVSTLKYLNQNLSIKPFLMGGNKLFLCKASCDKYDKLNDTLDLNTYYSTLLPQHEERQSIKARTLLTLFPNVQTFSENLL